VNDFSAISWREQLHFDDMHDDVPFDLNQNAVLDF
jgi:hypothetical protein